MIATGGAFKPVKCFYHLISFVWGRGGKWAYASNEGREDLEITVPLPGGLVEPIEHLSVTTSRETLGVFTCPAGTAHAQIEAMQTKAQEWIDRSAEGSLARKDVWFLLENQLWPKLRYGLCSVSAPWKQLEGCLRTKWHKIVPRGGLIRSAPHDIRDTDIGFYGAGCPHVGIECLIEQINKLLMHYGCASNNGLKLKVSLEFLIAEVGLSHQPLQLDFARYAAWVTDSWLKSVWEKCSRFQVKVTFHDTPLCFPRKRDQWLMQTFVDAGYSGADLACLNRVRLHQQALFLSDVMGPSGRTLDPRYLTRRTPGTMWSRLRFPKERPRRCDFTLWSEALQALVPGGGLTVGLGPFVHEGYKVWTWRLDEPHGRLLHFRDGVMDVYRRANDTRTRGAARWVRAEAGAAPRIRGKVCSVRDSGDRKVIVSAAEAPQPPVQPCTVLAVLRSWGNRWLWNDLRVIGDDHWLESAIEADTCVAVTDGSFIREWCPEVCSAAFILECSAGRGRIIGSFSEQSTVACAYRGELMGLMAIHLILLAANEVRPDLSGRVRVYSDCLGALDKVATLPPNRIPTRCRHSDILKNVMTNCSHLSFAVSYSHVRAHQDDSTAYNNLCRPAQLNCIMDGHAKRALWQLDTDELPVQQAFPREPITVFIGDDKMTSDTSESLRFWAHRILAEQTFRNLGILSSDAFHEVAWRQVYDALHEVPRLFQLWACKQVTGVAGTNLHQSRYIEGHDPHCPSCHTALETCGHVLLCTEAGRVDALVRSIALLDGWLRKVGTEPRLRRALVRYARGRGALRMESIVRDLGPGYREFGRSQDIIGWRRFMEGMVSREVVPLQGDFAALGGVTTPLAEWVRGLVVRLLEVTHGQWIYRNVLVHDATSGLKATQRKMEIQRWIEDQMELGEEGLHQSDHYLLEVNLEDLEQSSGEEQYYWLLQIQAARREQALRVDLARRSSRNLHE